MRIGQVKKRVAAVITCIISTVALTAVPVTAKENLNVDAGLGYYTILPDKILLTAQTTGGNEKDLEYEWTQVSGPEEVTFERQNEETTYAVAKEAGKYKFKITVTDGENISEDTTSVNVYEEGSGYGNPILPGMFADPHVYYDETTEEFYIFASSMDTDDGQYGSASTWKSKDFVNWEMTLNNWPIEGQDGWGYIWAPDIIKYNGKYYQFITNAASYSTWVAVSDSIEGPWKNVRDNNTPLIGGIGTGASLEIDRYNMDSAPFIDDDGQAYVYWGWSEPMVAKLNDDFTEIDGDVTFLKGTKWVADGGTHPQSATVDLGSEYDITKITTSPEFRNIVYKYTIETSTDKENWTMFADRTQNQQVVGNETYVDEGNARARYVKITILDSQGNWASLYDFSIYAGEEKVSLNKPVEVTSFRQGDEGDKITDSSNGPALTDFVEASYMLKHDGKYYLLYSSGVLHDGTYSVHYSVADDPMGPFITPENNVILQSNAEETTLGPGHNSILEYDGQYYIVYHQHNQPHVDGGLVFRQTCADVLEFNADGTIKPVVPTQTGIGALKSYVDQGNDLARGKYAVATSEKAAYNTACYALDANNASKWKASDNTFPQSLTVDLEKDCNIQRIETSFEYPTLSYKYKIETSRDNQTWETYADKSSEFPEVSSPQKDFKDAEARYVRITIYGCEKPDNSAGIYSFKVYGTASDEPEIIDKTEINELIEEISKLNEEDYTAESWEVLQNALTDAVTAANDPDVTQEQIDQMAAALEDAIAGLEAAEPGDEPGNEPGDEPGDKPGDEPGDNPNDKPGQTPDGNTGSGSDNGQNGNTGSGADGGDNSGKAVQTGDNSPILAYGMLTVLMAAGIVLIIGMRRRRR